MKTIRRGKMIRHYGEDIWIGRIGTADVWYNKKKKNTMRPGNIILMEVRGIFISSIMSQLGFYFYPFGSRFHLSWRLKRKLPFGN